MKVVHYSNLFSPLSQTFIYDYVTELERQGVECHFLTGKRENEAERPFANVHVVDPPSRWHPERLWHRGLAQFGRGEASESTVPIIRRRIRDRMDRLSPEAIHAHFGPEGVLVGPVAQKMGIPLVVSFHGYDAFELPRREGWLQKYHELFKQVSAVTVVSRLMAQALEQLGCPRERIHLIRVGKRMAEYPLRSEAHYPVKRWLFVGRFSEKKAPLDGVRAFERFIRKDRSHTLRMVGEGPLLGKVRNYVQARGLDANVRILGSLNHERVKEEMNCADAFLLCSKTASNGDMEGVPTVLMEAQALGLPCITTRHSGIPEVIPEASQWLLAEEGNVDDIASKMELLCGVSSEELRRIVMQGRHKVETEFNLEEETARLIEIYRGVIESPLLR